VLKPKKKALMASSPLAASQIRNIAFLNHSTLYEQSNPKNDRSIGNIKKNKQLPPRPKGKNGGAAPGIVVQVVAAPWTTPILG